MARFLDPSSFWTQEPEICGERTLSKNQEKAMAPKKAEKAPDKAAEKADACTSERRKP